MTTQTQATGSPSAAPTDAPVKKVTYRLELPSGHAPQLNTYIARLMRGQDLERWKANPAGLNEFLRTAIAGYMRQVSVVICTK